MKSININEINIIQMVYICCRTTMTVLLYVHRYLCAVRTV